jgi:G6PDH family F420-dependent oxidoreductase
MAEDAGFQSALISDHYHPWTDTQGHSPFVWGVIGGVAEATENLVVGTGVTCPTIRIHPAIVAQAAATAATMLPGRFFLGVGTGENLNEHILGDRWPRSDVRREMLEEAVTIIRSLWEGGVKSHHGRHYTVEGARIYTLPDRTPDIMVAAAGPQAAEMAAEIGDGFVGTAPDKDLVQTFERSGGEGKPKYGQVHVCWAENEEEARRTAVKHWPNIAVPGELGQELPMPAHFEQAAENVTEEQVAEVVACGPDPELHVEMIERFADAGFDHVYIHQIGSDQEGFLRFYRELILPRYS